ARRGQRYDAKHARAHPVGDRLDRAALSGAVAALEHDADLEALGHDPLLQPHQLHVQAAELLLVGLALHRPARLLAGLRLLAVVLLFFLAFALFRSLVFHGLPSCSDQTLRGTDAPPVAPGAARNRSTAVSRLNTRPASPRRSPSVEFRTVCSTWGL